MVNNKEKKWSLIKKEWIENKSLNDEQLGMLIRALVCSSMPKDAYVSGMYAIALDEYARVNKFNLEQAQARKEKAKKAAESRWNSMPKHAQASSSMLNDAIIDIDIDIDKGIDIDKEIVIDRVKEFDKIFE